MAVAKKKTKKVLKKATSLVPKDKVVRPKTKNKKPAKKILKKVGIKKKLLPRAKVTKAKSGLILEKNKQNPIIAPSLRSWESKATFNPTAIYHDGQFHILYRAIGENDNSVLGYANSRDGLHITESFPRPVFFPFTGLKYDTSLPSIGYSSGGGWGGGSEDPRMTLVGDSIYVFYTAFDGWGSVRIGLISISLSDFLAKHFNNWKGPFLISPPGEIHKNWAIFPEKINGKFAILTSISPNIMIEYLDSMDELNGKKFLKSIYNRDAKWASVKKFVRGIGPAPIKTKYGWLVIYHAIQKNDSDKYKLYAMMLDLKDPKKVLHDSALPILEPDMWYENNGYKSGVVYSCGAVVKDGELFVYYGGADKVSCVATANLEKFLKELIRSRVPKLKK